MILKDIRMKRGVDMNGSLFGNNNLNVESLEFDEDNNDIPTDVSIPEEYLEQSSSVSENKLISENNIIQESQINKEKDNELQNVVSDPVEEKKDSDILLEQNSMEVVPDDNRVQFYGFKCRDCSATFGKYGMEEVNYCVCCGCSNLDSISSTDESFSYVIPFVYSMDDAVNNYKEYIKFNPLIPKVFKSKKTLSSISKVYVSSELFNINLSGDVTFFAGDKKIVDNKEELKKFDVKNTVNFDFKDVLMCGNSKISIPIFLGVSNYDFQQIKSYDSNLVQGSNILLSDLSPMDISNYASNMVMDYSLGVIRKNVNHQLKKVNKNNIAVKISDNKSVLVPLYLLNVSYNGKTYTYIMNGSTGKATMKITYGKKEIIILSIILFVLIFAVSLLFVYFV